MYSNRPRRNWGIIAVVSLLGISNISMMNTLVSHKLKNPFPNINLPVGPYTSYIASVTEKGYTIRYKSHSPKIIETEKHIDRPAGFLGMGKSEVKTYEQSVAAGGSGSVSEGSVLTEKQIACIKAEGSGEATGRLAAASITAPITPALTEIPYVGWLVAGFFNMFGQKQGGEIGGQMGRDFADC